MASKAYDIKGAEEYNKGASKDPASIGIKAPDTHTLVLELKHPNSSFLGILTGEPWIAVHIPTVEAAGGMSSPHSKFIQPGKLVSNGPFVLAEWRDQQFVRVTRNPHFRIPPKVDEIRFFAISSQDAEERAYRSGQLHVTSSLPSAKFLAYQAAKDPALVVNRRFGTNYLLFNVDRAPFKDVRVRRALALAIDRVALCKSVYKTGETPAYSFAGSVPGGFEPKNILRESLEEALQLLAAAGFPDGKGFPVVEYLLNTSERNRDVAEAVQQMWQRNLGIKVTLRNEEWKVFQEPRRRGDYEIARGGWLPFTPEPIEMFEFLVSDSGFNDTRWKHAGFDRLYKKARQTLEPDHRYAAYHEMESMLRDEMPVVPLTFVSRYRLVHPSVKNWHRSPLDIDPWMDVAVGSMQ